MKKISVNSQSFDFALNPELRKQIMKKEDLEELKKPPLSNLAFIENYNKDLPYFKNYSATSKNENNRAHFFDEELKKDQNFFSQKKNFPQIPQGFYKMSLANKMNNVEKKHAHSFYEGVSKSSENFSALKKIDGIRNNILQKYDKDEKNLEEIMEENEKKGRKFLALSKKSENQSPFIYRKQSINNISENINNFSDKKEEILMKSNSEKEIFKLRIENRNLKKTNEELKQEITSLKKKNQEIDLLSDRDRTISENLDLKKKFEEIIREMQVLKEEKRKFQEKFLHLKEANEIVSQANFSLEEKFNKEKNEFMNEINSLKIEKKNLIKRLENKDREISEIREEFKNVGNKKDEDFKKLLIMHSDFSSALEKFSKNYKKN